MVPVYFSYQFLPLFSEVQFIRYLLKKKILPSPSFGPSHLTNECRTQPGCWQTNNTFNDDHTCGNSEHVIENHKKQDRSELCNLQLVLHPPTLTSTDMTDQSVFTVHLFTVL